MRLNSGYRAEIVRAAIEAAFAKEEKKLLQREHTLAKRCYDAVIPAKVRRLLEDLPENWLAHRTSLHFNITGMCVDLSVEKALPVPDNVNGEYRGRLGNVSDGPIAKDVQALLADKDELKARKMKAQATLAALVAQHVTTEELAKAWPEGKAYWNKLERKVPVANLPAVRIEELNSMLGLAEASA